MGKLKPNWMKTDIPKDAKLKLWRLMGDNPTFDTFQGQVSKHYDEIFSKVSKTQDKYGTISRDTYKALQYEIMHMPAEEVASLPADLQSWVKQLRPELKLEQYPRREAEEPDIEGVVTQLKARLSVPAPEDILINDFGGPGYHRIHSRQDTFRVIQENLGYGVSMVKATRESSSTGNIEINLEVSALGNLKLRCLIKGKDYSLSKKLVSSLSERAQQKFETWKQRGGQYLAMCSEIYREIHTEASYKTGQSIYEFGSRVFSKLGPPPLTPLFGDLVYQLCILYRRSRGQYGLPDRKLYQIKRRGLLFSALYLGQLHLANAPLSLPSLPSLPPPPSFLPPPPRPPPPPNFLETWIDLHRNMIVKRSASPAIAELLVLHQDLREIETAIKQELDGLIRDKQP